MGTSTAFVIHPDVRTMPLPRSADAMLAEAVQLVGAIALLGDGVLRRAVDGLVVAGLLEGNGRFFWNEDGVITAVFGELSGAD